MAIFMFIDFCIKEVLKYLLETYHCSIFSKIITWTLCALDWILLFYRYALDVSQN
jgi:hypothetical protein